MSSITTIYWNALVCVVQYLKKALGKGIMHIDHGLCKFKPSLILIRQYRLVVPTSTTRYFAINGGKNSVLENKKAECCSTAK